MFWYISLVTLLFSFANANFELDFLSEAQRKNLENIDENELTNNIQEVLRKYRSNHVSNPNEDNWCCRITPMKTVVSTTSQLVYIKVSQQGRRYSSCGFLWASRCTRYYTTFTSKPMYQTIYHSKQVPTTCPDNQLTCCNGYTLVAQHCLPNDKLKEIHQDLIDLHGQGVLG